MANYEFLQSPSYRKFREEYLGRNEPSTNTKKEKEKNQAESLNASNKVIDLMNISGLNSDPINPDSSSNGNELESVVNNNSMPKLNAGKRVSDMKGYYSDDEIREMGDDPDAVESSGSNVGTYAMIANAAGGIMSSTGKAMQENRTPEGYTDKNANTTDSVDSGVDMAKDTIAAVGGPFFQLFRGIQKMGEGLGDMVGGDVGAGISDAFSPEASTIHGWVSDDYSVGEKFLGTVPILGGVLMNRKKQEREEKWLAEKYKKEQEELETQRERNERLKNEEARIKKLTAVKNAQLGFIQNENIYA